MSKRAAIQRIAWRSNAEALLEGQNHALELIAGDAPLAEVLDFLVRFIESQAHELTCSVLLLKNGRLRLGAAPSLPDAYNRAIDGAEIGPRVGSCGTTAYFGRPVVVSDIATDPLWEGYRELALPHGLRACWSTPIFSRKGHVLGTFAMYYFRAREPDEADRRLVQVATHIAAIAIERHQSDEAQKLRAEALVAADRSKDELLAMVAHELKQPLTPVLTALTLIRRHLDEPGAVARHLAVIERQVTQLSRLVDDLLDVARIKSGKLALTLGQVSVGPVVERSVEACRPFVELEGHELAVDLPAEPLVIEADEARILQVVSNLLHNAAKYTPRGGHVRVAAAREGAFAVIRVADDGVGISAEMLPRIFELFAQADSSAERSRGGMGIGLTLVRRLVELHGGSVSAESEGPGRGSELTVRLPLAGSRSALPSSSAGP